MEFCKNRCQHRLSLKISIIGTLILIIITLLIIYGCRRKQEELKTCEPTMSVRKMGQFGNQVWEYMSLYVTWQANFKQLENYHISPYIDEDLKTNLEDLFENVTILSFPKIYFHCDDRETIIIRKDKHFQLPESMEKRNVLLDSYSARYKDVIEFGISNIMKELRFKEHYVEDIIKTLEEMKEKHNLQNNETTFIGMHYRGGDYIPHLQRNHGNRFKGPPNYNYYINAMDYFKAKYGNIIFILVSIDEGWLKINSKRIKDNGVVEMNPYKDDRNRDLTLLSHCNHSIINYGTFGVTAALFAQGDTIIFDTNLPIDYRGDTIALGISKLLPNWITMNNTRKN